MSGIGEQSYPQSPKSIGEQKAKLKFGYQEWGSQFFPKVTPKPGPAGGPFSPNPGVINPINPRSQSTSRRLDIRFEFYGWKQGYNQIFIKKTSIRKILGVPVQFFCLFGLWWLSKRPELHIKEFGNYIYHDLIPKVGWSSLMMWFLSQKK